MLHYSITISLLFFSLLNCTETILITGGAGYIGSHTAFYLKDKGYNIILLDNMSNAYTFPHEWATLIEGDCGDKELLDKIFSEYSITTVMHFAAFTDVRESVAEPLKYYINNTVKTSYLLESMMQHDVKQFIFSSTCATYGNPEKQPITENTPQQPINPYGMSKLMIEHMLKDFEKAYGLKYICLRYFNVAGALPSECLGEPHAIHLIPILLNAAKNQEPFTYWGTNYPTKDGTCIRDYIHVMDVADAHYRALKYLEKNKTSNDFNLGSGTGFSVKEVALMVEKISGLPIITKNHEKKDGEPAILTANPEKSQSFLGWKPQFTLEDMICDAYEYTLQQQAFCTIRITP